MGGGGVCTHAFDKNSNRKLNKELWEPSQEDVTTQSPLFPPVILPITVLPGPCFIADLEKFDADPYEDPTLFFIDV